VKFRGTLIQPLADQGDADGRYIDPDGVAFEEGRDYPLFIDFDHGTEPVGWAVLRREGGAVVAEGEITAGDEEATRGLALAAAVAFRPHDVLRSIQKPQGRVIVGCRLNGVSLTGSHADPGQPEITEIGPERL
jgi:hypothetical protein